MLFSHEGNDDRRLTFLQDKKRFLFLCLLLVFVILLFVLGNRGFFNTLFQKKSPAMAPNFYLSKDEDYYSQLKAGNNVLLFWGSDCPHCEKVIDLLQNMKNLELNEHLFTVSIDRSAEDIARHSGQFPIFLDYNLNVFMDYQVKGIPAIYIVDSEGRILSRAFGERAASQLIQLYYEKKSERRKK